MYSTMYADSALTTAESSILMAMTSFFATFGIFMVAIAIIGIIANWKIFSKAGKPGWACLVPIYANVVQFQIVGLNPWLLLLYLIPFVNFVVIAVFAIVVPFRLAKSFGKDLGWGFGLWLLPLWRLWYYSRKCYWR